MLKIKKYIKKPIPVEAVLLTEENLKEVEEWVREEINKALSTSEGNEQERLLGVVFPALADEKQGSLIIETPEGIFTAYVNKHYIVKGVKGEFYPVEKEIFEETYEEFKK